MSKNNPLNVLFTLDYGGYIYVDTTDATISIHRGISSPTFAAHTNTKCLQFSYRMDNLSTDSLKVSRVDHSARRIILFTSPVEGSSGWITARIDLYKYPKSYWVRHIFWYLFWLKFSGHASCSWVVPPFQIHLRLNFLKYLAILIMIECNNSKTMIMLITGST